MNNYFLKERSSLLWVGVIELVVKIEFSNLWKKSNEIKSILGVQHEQDWLRFFHVIFFYVFLSYFSTTSRCWQVEIVFFSSSDLVFRAPLFQEQKQLSLSFEDTLAKGGERQSCQGKKAKAGLCKLRSNRHSAKEPWPIVFSNWFRMETWFHDGR